MIGATITKMAQLKSEEGGAASPSRTVESIDELETSQYKHI